MTRREGRKGRRAASSSTATISAGNDASQLLPMALHHHERGDLPRARVLYEQVIESDPRQADALQFFGILCHQEGDAVAAEALIRRAIAVAPAVAPYHDNLGTVLERAGRLNDALAAYEAADALEPGDADRHHNMGLVLERVGRFADAESRLRRALDLRPDDRDSRFALANVLKHRGALADARAAYRRVLDGDPGHGGALVNLANLLQDAGELDEAARLYRDALARYPNDAAAHHNQARMLRTRGRFVEARNGFERALRHDPGLNDARFGLAQCHEALGELDRALAAFRALYEIDGADAEARAGLIRVARIVVPHDHDPVVERALLSGVSDAGVPASTLARALGWQLWARARLDEDPPVDDEAALNLARRMVDVPLFRVVLEETLNVVPGLERWLCAVRRQLLLDVTPTSEDRVLLRSLALQCDANDHVFTVTPEESEAVARLRDRIETWLADGPEDSHVMGEALILFACFERLADIAGAAGIPERLTPGDDWMSPVLVTSLRTPLDERERATRIAVLGSVEDEASRVVRDLYEEHPYPRWRDLPPASSIGGLARSRLERAAASGEALDILVAGCGTGQEPLAMAARFPGHRIVALDLSRASLAYGARMADQLGIRDVRFMHGDLQNVERLGLRFQVITATGVLHHMADPLTGWRTLRDCLAPAGVMKVGLYSATARAAVSLARTRIAQMNLASDEAAVRAFRSRILDGLETDLDSLLYSEDFYSTNTCRDLLFHPVEHQFDLNRVAQDLETLGLEFRGFELPHPLILRAFERAQRGTAMELGAWAEFESRNPDTFEAMYVFWCSRPADSNGESDA